MISQLVSLQNSKAGKFANSRPDPVGITSQIKPFIVHPLPMAGLFEIVSQTSH
jgi:hypothetical protein